MDEGAYQSLFFTSSLVPTYSVINFAKDIGQTILTGDGGDELFLGYDRYLLPDFKWLDISRKSRRVQKLFNYLLLGYEGTVTVPLDWSLSKDAQIGKGRSKEDLMIFDIKTELIGLEIPKVLTAARMAGVKEQRMLSPFLEKEMMGYAISLPLKYKYHHFVRKYLLRSILEENKIKLPHKKHGFAFPVDEWMGGELKWFLKLLGVLIEKGIVKVKN